MTATHKIIKTLSTVAPRFGTPPSLTFTVGIIVLAKYAETSRSWKKATVLKISESHVTVRFDGFTDSAEMPITRVKHMSSSPRGHGVGGGGGKGRKKQQQNTRAPLQPATQLLSRPAKSTCEQAVCTVRSCLSKLAPGNFEQIAAKVVEVGVEDAAMLSALVDLMFERAVNETGFTEIYARLFAWCAELMPSFDDASGTKVTFRKLLLNKTQCEFESTTERKRKLGSTVFVGQLWLHGLLSDAIVHGCVASVIGEAEVASTMPVRGGAGSDLLMPLQTDAVEVACTLLSVIGAECDASAAGRARMDAHMARLAGWAADKAKLPSARMRFKVMDVLDARKKGWKA